MIRYRLLDHTADLGFTCEGKSLEGLFETAALALCDVIARIAPLSATETREVTASGEDDAARLRAFLDEVLFLFERHAFLAREASVTLDGRTVRGRLRGQTIDPSSHAVERVVKAVTYHGLEVKKTRKGWAARVILDL